MVLMKSSLQFFSFMDCIFFLFFLDCIFDVSSKRFLPNARSHRSQQPSQSSWLKFVKKFRCFWKIGETTIKLLALKKKLRQTTWQTHQYRRKSFCILEMWTTSLVNFSAGRSLQTTGSTELFFFRLLCSGDIKLKCGFSIIFLLDVDNIDVNTFKIGLIYLMIDENDLFNLFNLKNLEKFRCSLTQIYAYLEHEI